MATGSSGRERVEALRREMAREAIDYYLVPSADAHQSEYVPDAWQRRRWLSGFTGSVGDCVVGRDGAWQWADSRYWLQAEGELDASVWEMMADGRREVPGLVKWLGKLEAGQRVGVDPRLIPLARARKMRAALEEAGCELISFEDNLVDRVWRDRPSIPAGPVEAWPERFAGRSVADKLASIRESMAEEGCTALALTTLDAVAWLFNIRGADVAMNPVVIAYGLVGGEGEATLFVDEAKIGPALAEHLAAAGVGVAPYGAFGDALEACAGRVWLDEDHASRWAADRVEAGGAEVHAAMSPVMLERARKNPVEQEGMRASHVRDAVAVCRYLHWLESAWRAGALDEIAASEELERLRAEGDHFRGLSFDTISGFGPNGAIVHYRATPATARVIDGSSLYLCDSGGQYLDGTTDVTRTVHLGEPTAEEREHYTRVLRGHLALGRAVFPHGTTGTHLDALARGPLWDVGLNYGHGTGHGVGCYLSVHQGPQRISPSPNKVKLEPGMVLSNEPGFYLSGRYGIRIENLVLVVERHPKREDGDGPYYAFEDLTLVPYCRRLIATELLSEAERAQVDAYHARVRATLAERVPAEVAAWLEQETAPLGA